MTENSADAITCVLVPVDGDAREVQVPSSISGSLDALQQLVGGYVEAVRVSDTATMLVNEDGLALRLSPNVRAGALARTRIVGDAVLTGEADEEGQMTAFTIEDWNVLATQRSINP